MAVDSCFESDVDMCFPSQLNNPTLVEGLVLINVDPCAEGWIDWAASKVSSITSLPLVKNTIGASVIYYIHFRSRPVFGLHFGTLTAVQ